MFNASAARLSADDEFEKATDLFAAELEDRTSGLTLTERKQLITNLLAVLSDDNATKTFVAGTYAQAKANNGSPAQALGSSGSDPERDALQVLVSSPMVSTGQKHALQRVLADPKDPGHLRVEADGTPAEVKKLQGEVTNLTSDANKAKQELADERDESKTGSLAAKLKAASSGTSTPGADFVKKSELKGLVATVKKTLDHQPGRWSRTVDIPKAEFEKAQEAAKDLADKVK